MSNTDALENKNIILNMINRLDYVPTPNVNLTISTDSKMCITKLISMTYTNIIQYVINICESINIIFTKNKNDDLEKIITDYDNNIHILKNDDLEKIITNYYNVIHFLKDIKKYRCDKNNIVDFFEYISNPTIIPHILTNYINDFHTKIMLEIYHLNFFEKFNLDSNNNFHLSILISKFIQCKKNLKIDLEILKGRLKSNIIDQTKILSSDIVQCITDEVNTLIQKVHDSNQFEILEKIKSLIGNIKELLEKNDISFIQKISEKFDLPDIINKINRIKYYFYILRKFDFGIYFQKECGEIIQNNCKLLTKIEKKYNNKLKQIYILYNDNIKQYFNNFFHKIIDYSNNSIQNLKIIIETVSSIIQSFHERSMVSIINDLMLMLTKLDNFEQNEFNSVNFVIHAIDQIELLETLGVEIEIKLFNINKLKKKLISLNINTQIIHDNLLTKTINKIESDVSTLVETFIIKMKDIYNKLEHHSKKKLLQIFKLNVQLSIEQPLYNFISNIDKNIQLEIPIINTDDLKIILKNIDELSKLNDSSNILKSVIWFSSINNLISLMEKSEMIEMSYDIFKQKIKKLLINIDSYLNKITSKKDLESIICHYTTSIKLFSIILKKLEKPRELNKFVHLIKSNVNNLLSNHSIQLRPLKRIKNLNILQVTINDLNLMTEYKIKLDNEMLWYTTIPKIQKMFSTQKPYYDFVDATIFSKITKLFDVKIDATPDKLDQINHVLKIVSSDKIKLSIINSDLIIIAHCFKISHIMKHVEKSIQNIYIYCMDIIIFDTSITLPGKNLIIISPNWIIEKNLKIQLSGLNALDPLTTNQTKSSRYEINGEGLDGLDGLPGNPGKNSGNFYGLGLCFDNINYLMIETNGGTGSNGQNGGNGSDGSKGKNATETSYSKWELSNIIRDKNNSNQKPEIHGIPYNRIKTYYGFNGKNGGCGGLGGQGGRGGYPGKVKIINENNIIRKTIGSSSDGLNGINGFSGKNGDHGDDLEVYVMNIHDTKYTKIIKNSNVGNNIKSRTGINSQNIKIPDTPKDFNKIINKSKDYLLTELLNLKREYFFYFQVQWNILKRLCKTSKLGLNKSIFN